MTPEKLLWKQGRLSIKVGDETLHIPVEIDAEDLDTLQGSVARGRGFAVSVVLKPTGVLLRTA